MIDGQTTSRRWRRWLKPHCFARVPGKGVNVPVGLLDLSEVGARLLVGRPLKPGRELLVTLTGGRIRPLRRRANVIWSAPTGREGRFVVGIQFQRWLPCADWQALVGD